MQIKILKQRIMKLSFHKKIMYIYVLAGLIPTLCITNIFFEMLIKDIKENVEESFSEEIELAETEMLEQFLRLNTTMAWISFDNSLHQVILNKYNDPYSYYEKYRPVHESLAQLETLSEEIADITFYHNNPYTTYGGQFQYVGNSIEKTDEFNSWLQTEDIEDGILIWDEGKRELAIYRYLSLYKSERNFKSVAKIIVDLNQIQKKFKNSELIEYYLVTKDNEVIESNIENDGHFVAENKSYLTKEIMFDNMGVFSELRLYAQIPQVELLKTVGKAREIQWISIFCCLFISYILIGKLMNRTTKQLRDFTSHLELVKDELLPYNQEPSNDEVGHLILQYNSMVDMIQTMIIEKNKDELRKQKLELENERAKVYVLYSQINPHFLSNTLNCIKMRCIINQELETSKILDDLSKMFRSLMMYKDPFAAMWQELETIENYLQIQKFRFEDKLEYSIIVDDAARQQRIPRMTLQPLVENACIHGLQNKKEGGFIYINAFVKGDKNCIIVGDDGIGITEEKLQKIQEKLLLEDISESSIGIVNVYNRLRFYYKERLEFTIRNVERGGTEIKIEIKMENDNV